MLSVAGYRIDLVLCGGVRLSVVAASIFRFTTNHEQIRAEVSATESESQAESSSRGFAWCLSHLAISSAFWTPIVTLCVFVIFRAIAPTELLSARAIEAQVFVAASMLLLLADIFCLNESSIPFTSEQAREQPDLALTVLKYSFLLLIRRSFASARTLD